MKNIFKWNLIICENQNKILKMVEQTNSDLLKEDALRLELITSGYSREM